MNVLDDDGEPFPVAGLAITCGLRNAQNKVVATLPVTPTSTPSQFYIQAPSDTWPLGRLTGDFRIVNGNVVVYSATFGLTLTENMTAGP